MMIKYRVHEVAKDLGLSSKDIIAFLGKYFEQPKNHMTSLSEEELDVIFEHYTRENQTDNLDAFLARATAIKPDLQAAQAAAGQTAEKTASKSEPAARIKTLPNTNNNKKPAAKNQSAPPAAGRRGARPGAKPANSGVTITTEDAITRSRTMRHVDIKGADTKAAVDLSKYDERLEELVPEKAKNLSGKKQKIKKNDRRGGGDNRRRAAAELEKARAAEIAKQKRIPEKIFLPEQISVGELALKLRLPNAQVVKKLVTLGIMASTSQVIDFDTAALLADEFGCTAEPEVVVTIEDRLIDTSEDKAEDLVEKTPVVVVMGHVDHGKTSLLDAIRHTNVAEGEAGGITQHIGAYKINLNGRDITFLDTPGHAAFTAMRARGAQVTDVAILIVAADDGIMPQTIEAINHAKSAGVSIIVAINKIDKPGANPDKVMQELTEYELIPEQWGGDTICVPISAKNHQNIDQLLESVLLVSDLQELKANPNRAGTGTVIEAKLDKGRGPVATVLVQNGTLHLGDFVIVGTAYGRVRVMLNDRGERIEAAGPATPVEIVGLSEVPQAGDVFNCVLDERMAKELAEQRKQQQKEEIFKSNARVSLDDLFAQISQGDVKELNVIVKADVQGSVEAVKSSLEKLSTEEVKVKVIHGAVGAITESDIMLANAANAIIVGFNVRPDAAIREIAERNEVDMRLYRVIYECLDEISAAMKGMLAPKVREVVQGHVEVREIFRSSGVGTIAGCYVLDGKITRNSLVRVVRDGIVVAEDAMASLKRFKDDAREVLQSFECGVVLNKFNDIKQGDVLEAYIMEEYQQ